MEFLPDLTVRGGRLESGSRRGAKVHAASYVRERRIVLDSALVADPLELRRILLHEVFHFVWVRLSNAERRGWEAVLSAEIAGRARGELGWSAEWRRRALPAGAEGARTRLWREYVCESFCDTGAWMCLGVEGHSEWTLAARHRRRRREWFVPLLARRPLPI